MRVLRTHAARKESGALLMLDDARSSEPTVRGSFAQQNDKITVRCDYHFRTVLVRLRRSLL